MALRDWIKLHEGVRLKPYLDTVGKLTIGVGRNLDDLGITLSEAELMLDNDILRCITQLSPFPWYANQPQSIKDALVNMCFNMGITRLLGFRKMIAALTVKDYQKAANEALDSKWAAQVHGRAKDIAGVIREGR